MQIVIDIPEDVKAVIDRKGTNETVAETLWQAVKNGKTLLKGHGRLIDADAIVMPMLETETDEKWMRVAINSTPTIIEVDKEAEYDS